MAHKSRSTQPISYSSITNTDSFFKLIFAPHLLFSMHLAFSFLSWHLTLSSTYPYVFLSQPFECFMLVPDFAHSWLITTTMFCHFLCWISFSLQLYNPLHCFTWQFCRWSRASFQSARWNSSLRTAKTLLFFFLNWKLLRYIQFVLVFVLEMQITSLF